MKEVKKIKNKLIIAFATIMILIAGLFGVGFAYAQGTNGTYSSIVQQLTQKFNLNPADVQSVFDQNRAVRTAQMQTNFEARLTQDVKDGKITDAQKQFILQKRQELQTQRQTNRDSFKNMNAEARKAVITTQRQDLQNWAKQNGIDIKYFFGGFGMRGHGWMH